MIGDSHYQTTFVAGEEVIACTACGALILSEERHSEFHAMVNHLLHQSHA